jgi:hypothetical protein
MYSLYLHRTMQKAWTDIKASSKFQTHHPCLSAMKAHTLDLKATMSGWK